ncbi:hypothetical protein [Streptomyces hoynatensis]|uniref:hypothetical protein n=1 Tax=Streptomyces hoynatensis TaxID=1141874 RepID=UPI0011C3BA94|nr:hypothetical protein [Streptomyces hoynatensis]
MSATHPEPADIAALDEELLAADEAGRLREHLARCVTCSAVRTDLAALRDTLAHVPAPTIPEHVAARIDAALDRERHPSGPGASSVSRETEAGESSPAAEAGRPRRSAAGGHVRRWWRPQLALAAAGALVLLGAGALGLRSLGEGQQAPDEAVVAEDHGRLELAGRPLEDQVHELLDQVDAPQTLEAPTTPDTSPTRPLPSETPSEESPVPEETTGEDTAPSQEAQTEDSAEPGVDAEATPAEVPSCVEAAIGRRETPLAAGEERYRGAVTYLVVFAHRVDPDQVDAYVVDADCITATPPTSGEVLAQESYPRD